MNYINNSIIWDSSYIIPDSLLGLRVMFYNGRKFQSILIKESMCGRRLCEFVLTKKIGRTIHKKKRGKR